MNKFTRSLDKLLDKLEPYIINKDKIKKEIINERKSRENLIKELIINNKQMSIKYFGKHVLKFKEIEPDLKQGKHVIIKNDEDRYMIISPYKTSNGYYRYTHVRNTIDEAKEQIGSFPENKEGFDDRFKEYNYQFHSYYIPEYSMPEVGDEMYLLKDCGGYKKGNRVIVGSVSDSTVSVEIHDTTLYLPLSCLGYLKGKCQQCLNPMQKGICECEAEVNRTSNREEEEKLDCCKFCNEHTIWEFCPCCGKKLNK